MFALKAFFEIDCLSGFGRVKWNLVGFMAGTCNPGTLEAEFGSCVGLTANKLGFYVELN